MKLKNKETLYAQRRMKEKIKELTKEYQQLAKSKLKESKKEVRNVNDI